MSAKQEQLGLRLDVDEVPAVYEPPPYQAHSNTSAAAAARIEPVAGTLRMVVLAEFKRHRGGLTDEELVAVLSDRLYPPSENTVRPRRVELVRHGWLRDSGRRRNTRSGRAAVVWEYVEEVASGS